MNSFVVVALAFLAVANAGHYHVPSAKILQGPSSKTTIVGPEGSVISAIAPGGQIVHEEHPGVVAHAFPVYGHAAHVVAHAAPAAYAVPVASHSSVVAHSSAYENNGAVIAGPSGTIATGNSVVAPAVSYAASVVGHVGHAAPVVAHVADGYEGQYVHDYSESLYDDGSYKPHLYY